MLWTLTVHAGLITEIDHAAEYYGEQFSGGATDFLLAIQDTFLRIEKDPEAWPRRSERDEWVRGLQVKNTETGLAKARKFPFLIIYKIFPENHQVIAYQLWASTSNQKIRKAPD